MVSEFALKLVPTASVTIRPTVYVPAVAKAWLGSCAIDALPSPKIHRKLKGAVPPLIALMKPTAADAWTAVRLAEAVAAGIALTAMASTFEVALTPLLSVTVRSAE